MIFIGVGSNLGDRWQALLSAWQLLERQGVHVQASSPVYETLPWGDPDQPPYLNAVWQVVTSLSPEALLQALQSVEEALGRPATLRPRWGARIIDLDLLAYGEERRESPFLTLPHPWIPHRPFVLGPWKDLAPYFYLPPWKATVLDLWQRCSSAYWGSPVSPPLLPFLPPLPPLPQIPSVGRPTSPPV